MKQKCCISTQTTLTSFIKPPKNGHKTMPNDFSELVSNSLIRKGREKFTNNKYDFIIKTF